MCAKRGAHRGQRPEAIGKLPADFHVSRGVQRESPLRSTVERTFGTEPCGKGRSVGKELRLHGRADCGQIPKISMRDFRASTPAPAAIHDGMHFCSGCRATHVQVCHRSNRAEESLRQVPIFVARIGIKTQLQAGIAVKGEGECEGDAAFFRIPSRERG